MDSYRHAAQMARHKAIVAMTNDEFAYMTRVMMKRNDISGREMARLIGFSESTISRKINARSKFTTPERYSIVGFFNLDLGILAGYSTAADDILQSFRDERKQAVERRKAEMEAGAEPVAEDAKKETRGRKPSPDVAARRHRVKAMDDRHIPRAVIAEVLGSDQMKTIAHDLELVRADGYDDSWLYEEEPAMRQKLEETVERDAEAARAILKASASKREQRQIANADIATDASIARLFGAKDEELIG